ncbi:GNAT family N-acetyltransferase [Streptomyces sp. NRRL F-5126]|uniref:GNAT family N-acetyltransferase n=1 Tax=Streptomyces sp. NRRL F-5126 TaxID=1463857 RepID=UPI0004C83D03|nr:GNAT family N-acetyltransferase [Streptomyces sp. NRRL F-5126]
MRIRVVAPEELGAAEIEAWRALRAGSGAPLNPFMEPEFTRAVGRVRPAARVAVVTEAPGTARNEYAAAGAGTGAGPAAGAGAGPGPVGFFPYEAGSLGRGRAIGLGVSDSQGAVLRPGLRLGARDLMRACSLSAWEFDNLEDGQAGFLPYAAEGFESPVIDMGDGYEAYEAGLRLSAPKFYRTTTAKERRLGRQAGEVRFVFDERDPAALDALMAWKSAQYRRTGRRDRFAKDWIRDLVRLLANTRTPGCSGVLSVLYVAGRPVAAHFGLRSATVLSCWFPAYDTEFAKYSPGLVLHLRMAEAAAAEGIRMLDLGRGAAEYKDSLKNGALTVYEGSAVRPGPLAVLHRASREPGRRIHSFVRNRPVLASLAQRTLNQVGRVRAR